MFLGQRQEAVWQRGHVIFGYDPSEWRRDDFGNVMWHDHYGTRDSDYGWEIDHIDPLYRGGSDNLANLRPLQWRANATRTTA